MTRITYLGFPRMGRRRELKRALETYWQDGKASSLLDTASELRARHWQRARNAGVDIVPVNDFSLYDHVLDTAVLFDAVPDRYRPLLTTNPLAGYFAMARGGSGLHALEMTKWFDTNYHYLVPELHAGQRFRLTGDKPLTEWREAQALGLEARPVLL
ncbi:MAG: 5-methyltetrahydropteroyltriglutamate--homocysteine S-methyltransferase, partial [Rhodanobacter sp.]